MDSLYHEIHVTLEWNDFLACDIDFIRNEAKNHGFHMGDLLLMKKEDQRSHKDAFFTSRAKTYDDAVTLTKSFCALLKRYGHKVIRYKIEDTVLDSKFEDTLGII